MHPPFSPARLARAVGFADEVLRRTVRWSVADPHGMLRRARDGEAMIFACRHGQLWPLLWAVRDCEVTVLTSRSGDGELLSRVLVGRGFGLVRGSSSRDALPAARHALRVLRAGGRLGLAVDGPRGPRGVVQDGVLRLARAARAPIVPLSVEGGFGWVARGSWDAFEVPVPGRRVRVDVGPPVEVGTSPRDFAVAGATLARALGGSRPDEGGRSVADTVWSAASVDLG